MERRLLSITVINAIIVGLIILFDYLFPIALIRYYEIWRIKSIEDFFPQFMRDLAESIRSGMTLPQAVESISTNDYGKLSPYVRKLNAQLDWGIPFDEAFLKFARSTKSKLIARISSTIIESHRYGGNLTDIFEAISKTSVEIERLREERKLYMHSQMITGYIIFFVFLVVIIGLEKYLVPSLTQASVKQLTQSTTLEIEEEYKVLFRNLTIIQGLFAGLVIGKLSEGAIAGGIKHSLFLIIIGVLVYSIATIVF